jgi:microcystin-dependent protein
MSEPFIGEIRMFGFDFAPQSWATCDGQLLSIAQNSALFSLLGTMYGGNGVNTFGLPDLRGRTPFHLGNGFIQGDKSGEEAHNLTVNEMPAHAHTATVNATGANQSSPVNGHWANSTRNLYATSANSTMTAGNAGGGQPHENRSPYLVINFCMAIYGIFPSRN